MTTVGVGEARSRLPLKVSQSHAQTHTFLFPQSRGGGICKDRVKEMFVDIMCKADSNGSCMLNRAGLHQADQPPLRK